MYLMNIWCEQKTGEWQEETEIKQEITIKNTSSYKQVKNLHSAFRKPNKHITDNNNKCCWISQEHTEQMFVTNRGDRHQPDLHVTLQNNRLGWLELYKKSSKGQGSRRESRVSHADGIISEGQWDVWERGV